MSDHGNTVGQHKIFGKQTFYENSSRIPLIFEGSGIPSGKRICSPASIMDLGPTLCEMAGGTMPIDIDGQSLFNLILQGQEDTDRFVLSEYKESNKKSQFIPGRMIRKGQWKLISYLGYDEYDLLFNLEEDPDELNNVLSQHPDKVMELKSLMIQDWDIEKVKKNFINKKRHLQIIERWGKETGVKDIERWRPAYQGDGYDDIN